MISGSIRIFVSAALILTLLSIRSFSQTTGSLSGFVRDDKTQAVLPGAVVAIEGTSLSTSSGDNGFYKITDIPVGVYKVAVGEMGYGSTEKFDITISSGNATDLNFDLQSKSIQLQEVSVRQANIKPIGSVNSLQTLGSNEISKYPGGNFDISKVVQSLPGVSGTVSFRNDIIIRGGAPNENVYYLDGVEIPTINHFSTQGSGGGPVGVLNVSFIDNVSLYSSAFPARYDNPLSGVLQFRQRTGNPYKTQGNLRLSASEIAGTLEGPLIKGKEKTTYIISLRRSYLQLLFKLIGQPFLPDYWDYQYKITHKPNNKNEFNLIGVGAIDNFTLNVPKNPTLDQLTTLDQIPTNNQWSSTVGGSWKHLFKNGYLQGVLSGNILRNNADKFDNNEIGNEAARRLKYRSTENEDKFRFDVNYFPSPWAFSAGLNIVYSRYDNSTFNREPAFLVDYHTNIKFWKIGAYVQISRNLFDDYLTLTGALRSDINTFTNTGKSPGKTLSPRFSAVYHVNDEWDLSASVARYFKIPPYTVLGYQQSGVFVNKDAKYIQSDHYTAGLEFRPSSPVKITLEGFFKKYDNYPISIMDSISLANKGGDFGILGNEAVVSSGKGKAYGVELTYQQRLSKHFYGIIAYTFYYSRFTGFNPSKYIPSAWDNRNLISFTGGYRFGSNWEVGVRARYLGPAPYTPYNITASLNEYPFLGQGQLDYKQLNTLRLKEYNAADVRIDKKWNLTHLSIDAYVDIQNVYNSKNPTAPTFALQRNADGSIKTNSGQPYNPGAYNNPSLTNNRSDAVYTLLPQNSGALLPTIGFIVAF